jgi:hypothetical protein
MRESEGHLDKQSEIRHLLRTVKTSLELAIMARAPMELLNRLGRVSGLLDALSQLPTEEGPAEALMPSLKAEGVSAVDAWERWQRAHTPAA